ncbi:diguanylate cyclase domain-containing protein [Phaeobacter porticola]|uniref:diguanylate cyclase domain-containing protein n=1 Tax=Phaeobacter porticola TaxID=1844006 RepID=UPI000931281F|nr:diguanylate cyclase [Phaeobacter porticola]
MQGTILIIDGVSTNRIMLKVQLSAAYYRVVQADSIADAAKTAQRCRPDLILTAMSLPDGEAADVKRALADDEQLAGIPMIAIDRENDSQRRLAALRAGIDDVLLQPLDDTILQARIRSLLRACSAQEELHLQRDGSHGFSMPASEAYLSAEMRSAMVALVTEYTATAVYWQAQLAPRVPYQLCNHQFGAVHPLMREPVPDAIVIELGRNTLAQGLRLLADLRARAATRKSVVIAVVHPADPAIAAEALDRGAHDVLQTGFDAAELALRIETQLRNKARIEQLRDSVRNGLRAAVEDPMTGLFNRRYAKPFLERVARTSAKTGESFAVMLADLDHFKKINDRYGHPVGDAVLIEAAKRLQTALRPVDLLARIGGEEFMIVMPAVGQAMTEAAASDLCNRINSTPFHIPGVDTPIYVTISIGAAIGGCARQTPADPRDTDSAINALITDADRALYSAKHAGRNQISLAIDMAA